MTIKIIYPTARGERCIPIKGDITPARAACVRQTAIADGCTDIAAVERQIEAHT